MLAAGSSLVALALCISTVATAGPTGTSTGGVGVRPAHPVTSHPGYYLIRLKPGRRAVGSVVVTNTSTRPASLIVYPVDGTTGSTSGAVFGNRGTRLRFAGRWVRPAVRSFTVAGGTTKTERFTVRVPKKTKPGEYMAGVAFQNRHVTVRSKAHKKRKHRRQVTVRQVVREVIAVEIVVPGRAAFRPVLTALGIRGVAATGIGAVYVGLADHGRNWAYPLLTVTLVGPRHYRKTLRRRLNMVLPGPAISYPVPWPHRLARGHYRITATLRAGHRHVTKHARFLLRHSLRAARR
jgi:hypothetical protein